MTKNEQLNALVDLYKQETREKIVDMDKVADWAISRGVMPPKPKTPRELLAIRLADAARAQYRVDPKTGLSYRANHALRKRAHDGKQKSLWVDIDDATRSQMLWSLADRRQQMVGDAVHLKIDELIWNSKHPNEEPIQQEMDFTYDVEERLNSPGYGSGEAA
jgi:hypothetical protein